MDMMVDEKRLCFRCGAALSKRHSLRACRRLVEQRGIGDVEAGKILHDGLIIEECFEPSLADLRLIGRVGGVPGRIFKHVALYDRRQDSAVIALSDQRSEHLVLRCKGPQMVQRFRFGEGRRDIECAAAYCRGDRLRHQLVEGRCPDDAQHVLDVARRRPDMSSSKNSGWRVDFDLRYGVHALTSSLSVRRQAPDRRLRPGDRQARRGPPSGS